nr:DUF2442 domain-containing protein [Ardenticatena sp.]
MTSSTAPIKVKQIYVTDTHIVVHLEDRRVLHIPVEWYPRLLHASSEERNTIEIYDEVIRWPKLDEDIRLAGLLSGRKSGESRRSFERWLASRKRS